MKPLLEAINYTLDQINNPRYIYKDVYQEMIDIQLNYNNKYCPYIFEDNSIDYDTECLYETLDMIFETDLLNYTDKVSYANELAQYILETSTTSQLGINPKPNKFTITKNKISNSFQKGRESLNNFDAGKIVNGFGTTIKNKMLSSDLGRRIADAHRYSNASKEDKANWRKLSITDKNIKYSAPKNTKEWLSATGKDIKSFGSGTGHYASKIGSTKIRGGLHAGNLPLSGKQYYKHKDIDNGILGRRLEKNIVKNVMSLGVGGAIGGMGAAEAHHYALTHGLPVVDSMIKGGVYNGAIGTMYGHGLSSLQLRNANKYRKNKNKEEYEKSYK